MFHIEMYAKGILGTDYEFDLPKGTNFIFDSSWMKKEKIY